MYDLIEFMEQQITQKRASLIAASEHPFSTHEEIMKMNVELDMQEEILDILKDIGGVS